MGLLDDAASMVSGRSSHSHSHSKHKSSSSHSKHHSKHRSRSRSRSSSRSRHHNRSSSHLPGIAASIFGVTEDKHHKDKHHHSSSARSIFGGDDKHGKHNSSRASFFGLGSSHGNASRSSFFGFGQSRGPSYYKRSPRPSFIQRSLKHLKRLLRDLIYYAKRHPVKVFALVIMPLVTGGFLTALLARFGLRLPAGLERMMGVAAKAGAGDGIGLVGEAVRMVGGGFGGQGGRAEVSVERGRDGGMSWERRRVERDEPGWGAGLGGLGGGLMGGVAKMFM